MAKETEIVIYAKLKSEEGFDKAVRTLHQEQAQIKAPTGRIRVRKERPDENSEWGFTLTTKKKYDKASEVQACDEENQTITEPVYEMFKSVCDQFFRKTRYEFAVEKMKFTGKGVSGELDDIGLKYEVDRFYTPAGKLSKWVKIDVEIDGLKDMINQAGIRADVIEGITLKLTALPIKFDTAFVDDGSEGTPLRNLVTEIYETEFVRKLV